MIFDAPFRLTEFMSKTQFKDILAYLRYTNKNLQAHKDGFHNVQDLIKAWNTTMKFVHVPSWVTYTNKLMPLW